MGVRRLLLIGAIAALAAPVLATGPATAAGPVEVLSARTEVSRLFDNRDGTFTLRQEIPVEYTASGTIGWTSVYSAWPKNTHWNGYNIPDGQANAGFNGWTSPVTVARSYFQFDVARLIGTRIVDAQLSLFGTYSAACWESRIRLSATTAVGPSTSWLNQPTTIGQQDRLEGGFCGGGRPVNFNVTGEVVAGLDRQWQTATFGIGAVDENDRNAWRKYGTANTGRSPVLSITFQRVTG